MLQKAEEVRANIFMNVSRRLPTVYAGDRFLSSSGSSMPRARLLNACSLCELRYCRSEFTNVMLKMKERRGDEVAID
jgi:hypothetical protein